MFIFSHHKYFVSGIGFIAIIPLFAEAKTVPAAPHKQAAVAQAATSGITTTRSAQATRARKAALTAPLSRTENVVVVGSALRNAANQNANPVQTVTAQQIQETSASTISDYLQRLPSIGSQGSGSTSTISSAGMPNGTNGLSCADLRNLGQSRVLVLVDGKRMVPTMGGVASCVDLSSIPIDQIASVEILKDGGSELYGADAVSGVINIKLKHNLTTGGLTIRGGITDQGDGDTGKISGYKGFNFDHGRGNITVFGQYLTNSPIMTRNRSWSRDPWLSDALIGQTPVHGSSITAATRVIDPNGNFDLVSNNTGGGTSGFHDFGNSDRFQYGNEQQLTNYLQESNLSGDAHYDINEHISLYSSVQYTHKTTSQNMAAWPETGSSYPSTEPSQLMLPAGSPYNIWGEDVDLYKRMQDIGDRNYKQAFDTWQVMGGARGRIVGDWNYDASMTYGESRATMAVDNQINYTHLLDSLGVRQLNPGNPLSAITYDPSVCQASKGCSLINPFGALSSSQREYIADYQTDHATYQMRDFNLRVDNNHLAHLPYKYGGDFALAGGLEHRSEQASYVPDPMVNSDLGGGEEYTGGGYGVTSVYLEGKLPLLHNAPFARDLTVDAQGRWDNYSTFGSTENWKASLNWAPTRDIRFRGTLGTSFRAPSVSELYGGASMSYNSGNDPCAQAGTYGGLSANVVAHCMKEGINPGKFVQADASEIPTLAGGNTKLQPEIGRTYTFGVVLTPRWIRGLEASVEYWHYTVQHEIGTLPIQYIVDSCYTGTATNYCSLINARNSAGQLTQVDDPYQNIGELRTSGIDFDLNYTLRLGASDRLMLNNNFQQVISYMQQNTPGGAWFNYDGRLFYQGGYGNPRVRDYATVTWAHDNFRLTYMMNYTGGMHFTDGTNDVSCKVYSYCKVPGIFSHDVTVSYRTGRWNFLGGVNNILNKAPPFVPDGSSNTASGLYSSDIIGRYVFLQARADF
ncbi:TonB-dependent receptor domain-containing protein [Acetobacter fallax]|uniref:TonB-dependent receptor domain-containing protein n=1 Tax=Acetobacter fallax TaxID=1737473 RepID=UPI0030D4C566